MKHSLKLGIVVSAFAAMTFAPAQSVAPTTRPAPQPGAAGGQSAGAGAGKSSPENAGLSAAAIAAIAAGAVAVTATHSP
jgi:hypothetical protein